MGVVVKGALNREQVDWHGSWSTPSPREPLGREPNVDATSSSTASCPCLGHPRAAIHLLPADAPGTG